MCHGNTQVLLNMRYGQLWPTKGALTAGSQRSQTAPTTLKAPKAWWKKDNRKRRFAEKPSHKIHLKTAPHAVPVYSFVLAALEHGHQQRKIISENKAVQHLCKQQLQGLPGEQTPSCIPLCHTNCFYIQHGQHQCESPSLFFLWYKHAKQQKQGIGTSAKLFFTEEKYLFHRLNAIFDSDLYI